jgi:hypothetical protein
MTRYPPLGERWPRIISTIPEKSNQRKIEAREGGDERRRADTNIKSDISDSVRICSFD